MKYTLGCYRIRLEEVNVTLNGNKINLPALVIIPLRDKFLIRHIVRLEPLLFSYNAKARHDMVSFGK